MTTKSSSRVAAFAACLPMLFLFARCGGGNGSSGTGGVGGTTSSGGAGGGAAGTTSLGGSKGTAGAGGTAAAGAGGTGGAAGVGGAAGSGGAAGGGGAAGSGGAAGGGGQTGSAGAGGNAGASGTAGAAGGGGTAGAGAGGATGSGTGGAAGSGVSALQTAELATTTGIGVNSEDPTLLTYTTTLDADGDPIAIGWGPSTFPTTQQRQASAALIRAIAAGLPGSVRNSQNTASAVPGTPTSPSQDVPNPPNALLTLGTDPASLLSGTGIGTDTATQALLTAYANAAIADSALAASAIDPGGLTTAQAASAGTLGVYIATNATNPSSAIGIAVNIVTDAVQYGLETQLKAF